MEISVYNDTGGSIAAAQVVYQTGIRYPSQLPTIALASAAAAATAIPMGITVDAIADATIGYIVITGNYYPIDTSAFFADADVFLDDIPGGISPPPGTVEALVGTVVTASASGTVNVSCVSTTATQRVMAIYNDSGSSLASGTILYSTGYSRPSQLNTVALASAASASTATSIGYLLRTTADTTVGQVIFAGDITADTSTYAAVGSKVYLSDTPGDYQTTAGTVSTVVGLVKVKDAAGTITILCQPVLSP